MNKKTLLLGPGLCFFSTMLAHASDIIVHRKIPYASPVTSPTTIAPPFPWLGPYVGLQMGYSWGKTNIGDTNASARSDYGDGATPDPCGLAGGIYAGYNFDANEDTVLGVETDWQWSNLHTPFFSFINKQNPDPGPDATLDPKFKETWVGSTRVRVGYAVERFLPYVTGGLAYARLRASANIVEKNRSNIYLSDDAVHFGWTLGAGLDYAALRNMILRIEYRYTNFGLKQIGEQGIFYKMGYKTQDIRLGIAYKF